MGKHGMTIEEAATFLGVTGRTVNNYLSRGLLSYRRVAGDRRRYLDAAELGELKSAEGTGLRAPITRAEFLEMRSRLRKLESHMETVLRVLDARAEPLGLDPARAAELHDACAARLAEGGWDEGELRSWCEVFLRLTEEDLALMAPKERPWLPFLRLCTAMTASLVSRKEYATSLDLQTLHRELVEARRRLRVAAVCHVEASGRLRDPDLRRALADSPRSLLDAAEWRLKEARK